MRGVGSLPLARSRLRFWGCPVVAGGCLCVEWIAIGEVGLSAVVVRCVVALCSVSLGPYS